jgi:hypothetical protein
MIRPVIVLQVSVISIGVLILTVLTQIGGIVLLLSFLTFRSIDKRIAQRWQRSIVKVLSFAALYLFFTFLIVPLIAESFGRVPMPVLTKNNVKPANLLTCLMNRNYVRPELRRITYSVAKSLSAKYPGAQLNYLDANFPFINRFPLLPHLSHSDGKKLDISFQYNNVNGEITNDVPSFIGYGICEEPRGGEVNKPAECSRTGNWQYNILRKFVPQKNKKHFSFDEQRTKDLLAGFMREKNIEKIFIEPHLKTRLGLMGEKIRFHGCQAVRHDDHIHVQLN